MKTAKQIILSKYPHASRGDWMEAAIDCMEEYKSQSQSISQEGKEEEWISVEDELPKEGGRYWCYVKEINDLGIGHFQWNCSYHEVEKRWSDNLKTMTVTHWMPLPKPPSESSKESTPSTINGTSPAPGNSFEDNLK